ncbi:MAG: hypothetical protein HFJ25_01075 [Clostridia bacterium]|nr:hypothetical protein [Clostridia bacterium]
MKKRSSKDIKKIIIMIVLLMLFVLIGLIVFLFSVDVRMNEITTYDENANANEERREGIQDSSKNVTLENYELFQFSENGKIEIKLLDGKVFLSINDDEKVYNNIEIDVKENTVQDIFIGEIDEKDYLLVINEKGSVGIMNIDRAVQKNRFEIEDNLITFEKAVVRIDNANMKLSNGFIKTIIVFTSDDKKYDLSDFVG